MNMIIRDVEPRRIIDGAKGRLCVAGDFEAIDHRQLIAFGAGILAAKKRSTASLRLADVDRGIPDLEAGAALKPAGEREMLFSRCQLLGVDALGNADDRTRFG